MCVKAVDNDDVCVLSRYKSYVWRVWAFRANLVYKVVPQIVSEHIIFVVVDNFAKIFESKVT